MTQAIQMEASNLTPHGAAVGPAQVNSPGAETGSSPFAQLLAIAQHLYPAGEPEQAVPLPAASPLPEQQQPPSAGEIEQMVASAGLPLFTVNMPSVQPAPLPEAHTPDAGAPSLPFQMAILPQVATDAPAPTRLPADAKAQPVDEGTDQAPLQTDAEAAAPVVQLSAEPTKPAQQTPSVSGMPPQSETILRETTNPAQAMASSVPDAQTLPKYATDKPQAPSESSASATEVQKQTVAPVQAGHAGQTQSEQAHDRHGTALTASRKERLQPKRQATPDVAGKPTPPQLPEAHLQHIQGAEAASAPNRVQETVTRPSEVSPAEVVRQVARQVETMVNGRSTSSVTLQLEPEHLGRLRVTISLNDGAIHTHIVADNHAVRQMLESNSTLLQQALQERGLQLGALQVSVQGDGRYFLFHQPYTSSPPARGWLEAETSTVSADETRFGWATPAGINLLA